jgi:hypothetical protein
MVVPIPASRSPEVVLILEREGKFQRCVARVDGQAGRSLLPFEIATGLGFGPSHLRPNLRKANGAGETQFRTWGVTEQIKARIGTTINGKAEWIGPYFQLAPLFFKTKRRWVSIKARPAGPPLLGRFDFYDVFEVTDSGTTLKLSWEEPNTP